MIEFKKVKMTNFLSVGKEPVEIELNNEEAEIRFPADLKVIKEVTEDDSFKNASLAKR